jgi:tetratricopeptide (TPR) repeat protein
VKKQVETTVKTQPKSYPIRMQAAQFYMQASDFPAALPHLEAAVQLSPKQFMGWLALGDCATLAEKLTRAEQAYAKAAAIDPRHPLVFRGRGQLYLIQQNFSKAQAVLEAGLKINPLDVEIRTALGNVYLIANKPRMAVEALKPAVDAAPNRPDLHYLLGEAYARDLSLEKAIVELTAAAELEPRMDSAWGRKGLYLNSLTRYSEARAALEKAVALDPKNSHYQWALGDTYILDWKDSTSIERGLGLYQLAVQLDPTNTKALYAYGMALSRRGTPADLKKAITLFEQLVKVNPIDTNGYFKLAETYRRLGMKKEADARYARFQVLFEKGRKQTKDKYAAAAFLDTAESHTRLGQRYLQQGKWELAVKEFLFALERDPNSSPAKSGLAEARGRRRGTPRALRSGATP